jgi:peptidylprolyl isomerase
MADSKSKKDVKKDVKKDMKAVKPAKTESKPKASASKTAVPKNSISKVGSGHAVSVEYVGTLEDGSEFDNSKNHGPLKFVVGSGQVIKGFDDAVMGMKVNEQKTVKIQKENAYGDINPQLVHNIPMTKIPQDMRQKLKVGGYLVMQSPTGHQVPAKVQKVTKDVVTLDMNHPLAGKDLTFNITVKDISVNSGAHEHECSCHGGTCSCSGDGDCKCSEDGKCGCGC